LGKYKEEELAKALQDIKDKLPMPTTALFDHKAFMRDEEAFNTLMDQIAMGKSVRAVVADLKLPPHANVQLNRALVGLKAPDPRFYMYQEAKAARAAQFADQILDICHKVDMEIMTHQQGVMVSRTLMWLAARLDPGQWSDRIQVDANVRIDVQTQHLEAVRLLATMVKERRPGLVYEGEKVRPMQTVEEHELLN